MGYTNAVSLDRLIQEVNSEGYDAVIHVGGNINCWTYMRGFLRSWHIPDNGLWKTPILAVGIKR